MNFKSLFTLISVFSILFTWQGCKSDDDTDLPYILLDGANPYNIDSIGGTFTEQGYRSVDDVDGDLTANVIVSYPTILTDSARTYAAVYSVTDRSGNTFTTRRYIVVRNTGYFIDGFYSNCTQFRDTTNDTLFAAAVVTSPVSNYEFSISNFGNLGYNSSVLASYNPVTQKILINTPQLLADSSTLDYVNPDSSYYTFLNGDVDSLAFQIFYTHSKNGNSENCRAYYRK